MTTSAESRRVIVPRMLSDRSRRGQYRFGYLLAALGGDPRAGVSLWFLGFLRRRAREQSELFSAFHFVMPIAATVSLGTDVTIFHPTLVNLYGCSIGKGTKIGTFVEIQKNARIGERCKISSHSFVCEGVVIEDEVFVGHGVMFTNDKQPRATNADGSMQTDADWQVKTTLVKRGASIGSNATILCGVTIGAAAMVGAGAVVTRDVPDGAVVAGVPARVVDGA